MFKLMLTNLQSKCKFKLLVLTILYTGLGVFIFLKQKCLISTDEEI